MKNEIIKISKKLEQGTITETKAQTLLLGLFGVNCRYTEDNMRTAMEWGMNIGETSTVYTENQFNELLNICN